MSGAEVLPTAIVAMLYFQGVIERARTFLQEYGYIPHMFSKSRLNRRLHHIRPWLDMLVDLLAEAWIVAIADDEEIEFALDTFPIPACDNIRISRADKAYNHYTFEDFLQTTERTLLPMRKKNSKSSLPPWMRFCQHKFCKSVETAGNRLFNLWPRHLHAVTQSGFLLKAGFFILALSLYDFVQGLI